MPLHKIILLSLVSLITASPAPEVLEKRGGVECLTVGELATARWVNAKKQTCTFQGYVGSNYGASPSGTGDYSCNGRCGGGCTGASFGNAYTQDCFSHDICSYFYSASGGADDPNCGAAYNDAIDDTVRGSISGCARTNPSNPVVKPKTAPVCV